MRSVIPRPAICFLAITPQVLQNFGFGSLYSKAEMVLSKNDIKLVQIELFLLMSFVVLLKSKSKLCVEI